MPPQNPEPTALDVALATGAAAFRTCVGTIDQQIIDRVALALAAHPVERHAALLDQWVEDMHGLSLSIALRNTIAERAAVLRQYAESGPTS